MVGSLYSPGMQASEITLKKLFDGQRQYRVPLFQRPYSWSKDHREQLWSDIHELCQVRAVESTAQHFLGSIVTSPVPSGPERPEMFLLIDGQQRLTTLAILLAAIRDVSDDEARAKVESLYLRNQFADGLDEYKVLPTQADRAEFWTIMSSGGPSGMSHEMRQTYSYFGRVIRRTVADDPSLETDSLISTILNGLALVSVTLEEKDNPYRVFESLNATGLRLNQVDLLRNYYFMRLDAQVAEVAYRETWLPMQNELGQDLEAFAHDYVTKTGEFVRRGDVYKAAKRRLDGLEAEGVYESLKDMRWFAQRWARISHPELEPDDAVRAGIVRLNKFGSDTVWPFVLNLYEARERDGFLTAAEMADILDLLVSFLVRRMFARVPTNQLNRLFLTLWRQLPKAGELPLEVATVLAEPTRRWPNDEEFTRAFVQYPLYTDSRPAQRRLVLEELERSFAHKEEVALDALQIEHVMPQSLTAEWVATLAGGDPDAEEHARSVQRTWLHTIGNLTLTGYNPELSNDPWPQKREYYAASNVELSKALAHNETWAEAEIAERAHQLAQRALGIWRSPVSEPFASP